MHFIGLFTQEHSRLYCLSGLKYPMRISSTIDVYRKSNKLVDNEMLSYDEYIVNILANNVSF